jgi:MFS family permease
VRDADEFYQEFARLGLPSEGIPRLTAPVDQPWGMREFALVDPSGNLVRVIAACVLGQALPLWFLTIHLHWVWYCAALAVSGIANGLVNPSIHALMTLRIPPALRPTVMTTMMIVFATVQPVAVLAAGPVLGAFGPEPVLVGFAAVQTASMLAIAASSLVRANNARRPSAGVEAA